MTKIAGKTVLVTGISRGIGVFIARELAKKQATIVGVSRSQEGLDRVCAEINAMGIKAIGISSDISKVEQLSTLVEEIQELVGSVDILINNAGIETFAAFPEYSLADVQSVLSVNLIAAMELTRLVLPNMLSQGSGHIVNIASLAAKKGEPYNSIYSASKAGLLMWANAVRQELAGTGINISTICPGYISNYGMIADTGVSAPRLAGTSQAEDVAKAVIQAIEKQQAEVIVNGNTIMQNFTKVLLATEQLFPQLGDAVNHWLEIKKLNKMRRKAGKTLIDCQPKINLEKEMQRIQN